MNSKNDIGPALAYYASIIVMPVMIIGFVVWIWVVFAAIKKSGENYRNKKSMIGKSIVIKKDTVMIIDHSLFSNTYKLDNGLKLNCKIIDRMYLPE